MKDIITFSFFLLSFILFTSGAPLDAGSQDEDPGLKNNQNDVSMTEKLEKVHSFGDPEETWTPDTETLAVKKKAKCGVSDIASFELHPGNFKWERNNITYRFLKYTSSLRQSDVDQAIEKAFSIWSKVTPLTFERLDDGVADIMMSFERGDHGDNSPFYGHDTILAHAFPPGKGYGGDVHFDEDKLWTVQGPEGYNLFLVAAHEIGHALGLSHSSDIGALMYPTYSYTAPDLFQLPQDDIDGIQAIYGKSDIPARGPRTPKACDPSTTFDAITTFRGEMHFFKGRFFWRKHPQYPIELNFISTFWPKLPSGIQAAYENFEKDQVVIFKGNKFWVLDGYDLLPGYPQLIYRLGLPRNVKRIDAAFSDSESGKTYFFVGDKFWRYDEINQSMETGYPQKIAEHFKGVGPKIDAAMQENGYIYFFQRTKVIQFDPNNGRVVSSTQKSNSWLNC